MFDKFKVDIGEIKDGARLGDDIEKHISFCCGKCGASLTTWNCILYRIISDRYGVYETGRRGVKEKGSRKRL